MTVEELSDRMSAEEFRMWAARDRRKAEMQREMESNSRMAAQAEQNAKSAIRRR